jgi:regulator of cell morphogenesis and NO signaling
MGINGAMLIREIVKTNYTAAHVFEKYGIDYCCGGDTSLEKACSSEGLDTGLLIMQLDEAMKQEDRGSKYIENLPLSTLCDYIVETHHRYVHEKSGFILEKLQKLCEVHGDHQTELFKIREMFNAASENLKLHMEKEETVLFPYIREMEAMKLRGIRYNFETGNTLDPIEELKAEHTVEGDRFRQMAVLTNQFQVPSDGCNTFEVTYRTLDEFVRDLHRHIHLENNILFPKSALLENELTKNL